MITLVFKKLIPTASKWQEHIKDYLLRDSTVDDLVAFRYLFNNYANSNVAYDTPDAFFRHFFLTYENLIDRFTLQRKILDKQYNVTPEELSVITTAITNSALNNAERQVASLDNPVDYIDNQVSSKQRKNELNAYVGALYKISDRLIFTFINEFNKHFLSIFPEEEYYYAR